MPDYALNIALNRMGVWLARLYAGTDPEAGDNRTADGRQPDRVRNITFAQAVAEGLIPPSGEPMAGPLEHPAEQ